MGQVPSAPYQNLSRVIPQVHSIWDDGKSPKPTKTFRDQEDRDQFIHSILSLVSSNGQTKLDNYAFKLLYARKPNDRVVATLVAIKAGVIESKIEPPKDGKDSLEAWREFKKHVEARLHELLETVPDAAMMAGPSSFRDGVQSPVVVGAADLPPSYENAATKGGGDAKR
ncbi:hypothetical protein M409DRAFT_59568 [Zasmidium cellare ATCC 36951]|uniref:Uncharacterized protein n=1 Tax=Zasmidium cellare ATCC 36951 TaxID=1080233 RepID=A0A6A6C5A7_ZASCE|nr:uncharacterized protein M409DRAFT_59568 [Zasmidium cellare ATCC 36951]KAF2161052.1 hypothetical protein M409DRAFT_59568 [Zasmidium cellare ATCC 36951]